MTIQQDILRRAAHAIRAAAHDARQVGTERWIVDQNEEGGLIVGSFTPGDIDEHGGISTSVVAGFQYADDDTSAPAIAVPMASHIAGLDPAVGLAIADWLDLAADRWGQDNTLALGQAALHVARVYLRETDGAVAA